MKKNIIKFGLISGIVVSVFMFIGFSDIMPEATLTELFGYSSMIVAFSTIFFAIRSTREQNGGIISFKNAFWVGLGVTLIASTLYVISWMIISETIAQDFMANYYEKSVEALKAKNLPEAEYEKELAAMDEMLENYKNPVFKAAITFMEIFPVGLIVSLISAAILKRK